jgi:DNA-binding MarR family transcriptional regulator
MSKRLNALSRGSGMTPTQLSVLGSIARSGPLRMTDLAALELLNPTMLSRVVAALEDQGYVRRKPDPADRRARQIEVTAAGRRTHDRLRNERGRIIIEGLGTLDDSDARLIERALPALESLVDAITAGGAARR